MTIAICARQHDKNGDPSFVVSLKAILTSYTIALLFRHEHSGQQIGDIVDTIACFPASYSSECKWLPNDYPTTALCATTIATTIVQHGFLW